MLFFSSLLLLLLLSLLLCCCCCCYISVNLFATLGAFSMKDLLIKFWSLSSLVSLLFLLHAPWLTKSSKLFKTLSCTKIFLTIENLENSALYLSSHSSIVLDHSAFFTLFLTLILSSISEFPSSVNYSKAKLKSHELILDRIFIPLPFKQKVQEVSGPFYI